jgi:hypothetical protein
MLRTALLRLRRSPATRAYSDWPPQVRAKVRANADTIEAWAAV